MMRIGTRHGYKSSSQELARHHCTGEDEQGEQVSRCKANR